MSFISNVRNVWAETSAIAAQAAHRAAGPTAAQLGRASPDDARKVVDGLTPTQTQALKSEVRSLPVADRGHLVNKLAGELDARQLVTLEQVFGREEVERAVETFGNATTRAEYRKQQNQPPQDTVTQNGNGVVVDTTDADDRVTVRRNADTGDVTVTVNGTEHRFSAGEAEHLTVRTNGGNDVVDIDPEAQVNTTIEGGAGNDVLAGGAGTDRLDGGEGNDLLIGGRGSDTMNGGDGNDQIQEGIGWFQAPVFGISSRVGGGNDVVDAGNGNDTINTGSGNDRVSAGAGNDEVDTGTGNDNVAGGDGDDRIQAGEGHDEIDAGQGDDYVDGFKGNDRITGGDGIDTLYAGEGDDNVDGGAGRDYVDGYLGKDLLSGGADDDVISGGQGEDSLFGDAGNDVIYAGAGRDLIGDYDGTNTIYRQNEDRLFANEETRNNRNNRIVEVANVPDNIRIEGSPEFQARMRADLETLAASPTGQQMLDGIESQGDGWGIFGGNNHLTITETTEENGFGGGQFGGDGNAQINPSFHLDDDDGRVPPITVLYHELAHAYAAMSDNWADGTFQDDADTGNPDIGINNAERQAVGLTIDHDEDPSTPAIIDPDWSPALTENALRAEMGYDPRRDYR